MSGDSGEFRALCQNMDFQIATDFGISPLRKLGLSDFIPFEIGILGFLDLPFQGPCSGSVVLPVLDKNESVCQTC